MLAGKLKLGIKYHIDSLVDLNFRPIIHPVHLVYLYSSPFNTLPQFFSIIEQIEPELRDQLLFVVYLELLKGTGDYSHLIPRDNEDIEDKPSPKLIALKVVVHTPILPKFARTFSEVGFYEKFKAHLWNLNTYLTDDIITRIVNMFALNFWLNQGDFTAIKEKQRAFRAHIAFLQEIEHVSEVDIESISLEEKGIPHQIKEARKLYELYCEFVVRRLIEEQQ